ncbi:right-handed parallel beta-helix repeat-containing protein [Rhizobium sp. Root1203]|uniref:right-handed parallel beta-helix repeat-containing protein n=1 Tax=Rhizobium sp. Root1203 TaxID=1736427 RepID=UPI0009E7A365
MPSLGKILIFGMAVASTAMPARANAAEIEVGPPNAATLQQVLDASADGDTVRLAAGSYPGPLVLTKAVVLEGVPGAVIVGHEVGSVITLTAPRAVVRGLTIKGSGFDLAALDSGVFVAQSATGAVVEDNLITGNLNGVYLHGAADAIARRNEIQGLTAGRMSEAGNGVSLWNAPGAQIVDNTISFGKDGISTNASRHNVFTGNRFRNLRFAVHYMYTNDSVIAGNVSEGNLVGYAIMFSSRLTITDNVSDGDRDHGLLLNFANGSTVRRNKVVGRLQPSERWTMGGTRADTTDLPVGEARPAEGEQMLGPEKCVFIYNANRNVLESNLFQNCAIGIHFTAGSEGNEITGNAFVSNRNQVKYVGSRYLDWSKKGRGNYWSDNPSFDLDGDGLGDGPYRPNDIIDTVLWTAPQAKVLTTSPAVQIIRWAQAQFPSLLPGGVIDSKPLMAPPAPKDGSR